MHVIHDENEAQALGALIEVMEACWSRRDADAVLRFVDDQIQFIGMEDQQMVCGKKQFEALLRHRISKYPQGCRLNYGQLYCGSFGRECVLISGEIKVARDGAEPVALRLSAMLKKGCEKYILCGVHISYAADISR